MARGLFRTRGSGLPNIVHVEYEPGWTPLPIVEQVYRERVYGPAFELLPWVEERARKPQSTQDHAPSPES
jgi:hypothetical protein